ncbi:zinc protease [Caloranaerobacter azorensis H53214]|uniref:Zinc protease n=1 Tax=Caloranaerobacter azorensis H53214 TaxID=1156417 RepID=A0A096DNL2_9FIRM|nr:pitrilysin family protein [Caloranaerobacter azorensis]KGG80856.1 zinc protease [Caloranaerobacter azorensis H53214]
MFNKIVLENGLRIVTENIPYVKSVSIGIWIETGSRFENQSNNGISHFIEHMLFKGTENRTAKQIAESIDSVGGQLNAFTSKEFTCFYAKVLDEHLPLAVDVLADMIFNSKFNEEDIIKEKNVVFEEINMYEDSPEDLVHDLICQTMFDGHPLAYPILGSSSILEKINRKNVLDYYKQYYTPNNTVISIAGNFDTDKTIELIYKYFSNWIPVKKEKDEQCPPMFYRRIMGKTKNTEQLHLCLGMKGVPQGTNEMYHLMVLNNIFGGSMSSRLFQKIREERGLAYSIYSYPSSYKDTGMFTIYVGLNPNYVSTVLQLITEEIDKIKNGGMTSDEIYKSKEQLKGNYILGLESTSSRMSSMGKSELLHGKIYRPKEILEMIDSVQREDVENIAKEVLDFNRLNISFVGDINNNQIESNFKKIIG